MRDYDPTLGRYIQADPLGLVDGASVYGYALQNPVRWSDPRGEFVFPSDNPAEVVTDPVPIGGGGSGGPAWSPIAGLGALIGSLLEPNDSAPNSALRDKVTERKAYKKLCTSPPKPTGDYCLDPRAKLDWQKQCLSMRRAYGKKYNNDSDPGYEIENRNYQRGIDRMQRELEINCPNLCAPMP